MPAARRTSLDDNHDGKLGPPEEDQGKHRIRRLPMVLYLEGNLDHDLDSRRTGMDTLRGWCDAYGVDSACKTIHRLEDLEIISASLSLATPPAFVHLACHGAQDESDGRTYLSFTGGSSRQSTRIYVNDTSTWQAFQMLSEKGVKSLLLDACLVGKYEKELHRFCRECGFDYVAASPRPIDDFESLTIGPALYYAVLDRGLPFDNAVERVVEALKVLGMKGTPGSAQKLLRVFKPG